MIYLEYSNFYDSTGNFYAYAFQNVVHIIFFVDIVHYTAVYFCGVEHEL